MGEPRIMALTVKQPWAHFIANSGKRVENRTWTTPYRGLIAIHAGAYSGWDRNAEASPVAREAWKAWAWVRASGEVATPLTRSAAYSFFSFGAVIAVATLAGCHRDEDSPLWRSGSPACSPWAVRAAWHWELEDARPLPWPVPCKGKLGLWKLPAGVEKAVRDQLAEVGDVPR